MYNVDGVIIMARTGREISDSGIYHVMMRGVNKQNIFEDDEDRFKFIEIFRHFKKICKYEIYGYCLMGNHIHILIKELEDTVSDVIRRISATYVLWYNKKYDRIGHLFQGRFKSEPVNDDLYFITVLRYIHQNPLKARIVNTLAESQWTSYHDYISNDSIVDTDFALGLFSSDKVKAINLYKKYMNEANEDKCLDFDDKILLNDEDILNCLKGLGVSKVSNLQQMDLNSRNDILKKIKNLDGISIRQISRVTGISKSVIGRL